MIVSEDYLLKMIGDRVLIGDGCWEWKGSKLPSGYPTLGFSKGRKGYAHRFMYELLVGPIPKGLELDHLCRNRSCVRPSHLEAVTHAENLRRGGRDNREGFGKASLRKTHCKQGHPFAGDNLVVRPDGRRACRVCLRAADRRFKAKASIAVPG